MNKANEVYITLRLDIGVPKMIAFMLFLEHRYPNGELCKPDLCKTDKRFSKPNKRFTFIVEK